MLKKIAAWAVGGFILFFIVTSPKAAATVAKGIGTGLADVATGLSSFS
jgi:hypothetical protein